MLCSVQFRDVGEYIHGKCAFNHSFFSALLCFALLCFALLTDRLTYIYIYNNNISTGKEKVGQVHDNVISFVIFIRR
ncbi:hypothetical protein K504DRAFT_276801 [Pleomassaria siparia CBS 279.74]|uniref:Uncharacterized protein n=1 Tax=Pleomassaria siparia CBS 279.74 TaxID=1314801 RepID=A0A6G1KA88_9PLEO|nr:hypothetical protein K504DRAFT_276801 [Pleomassaria siparia CBS 279.74]